MSDKKPISEDRFDEWIATRNTVVDNHGRHIKIDPVQKSFGDRCEDIADAVLSFCMSAILIIVMIAAVFGTGWLVVCEMKRMVEAS